MRDGVVHGEAPARADVGEGEVAVVAQGDALHGELREQPQLAMPLQAGERSADPLPGVCVHHVPEVARRDQEVLVAVEIHVQEQGIPRPIRRLDPGVSRDLSERAVAAVLEQRVALPLRPVVDHADQFGERGVGGHLGLAARPPAQHVHEHDVHVAVAVDVGEIDRHGRVAGVAERQAGRGAECPLAVVQPEHVRILEIIAYVEVRCAVAVHVGELGGEPEVLGRRGERLPVLVAEPARRPRDESEVPPAVVQVEPVGVRALLHRHHAVLGPVHGPVVLPEPGDDLEALAHLAHHLIERPLLRRIDVHRGPGLVVGDVEVEATVPVHVGERHGHAAAAGGESRLRRPLREDAVPVVHEQRHAAAQRADQQIEVAVPVHVGEHGAHGVPSGHRDAGPCRDVLEAPIAQVLVEGVRALVAREVDVGEPVAVDVAQSHAAALREMAVEERAVERDGVDEADPGPGRGELGEARAAALPHREVAPAVPCLLPPRPRSGGMPAPEADRQDGGDAQPEGPPPPHGDARVLIRSTTLRAMHSPCAVPIVSETG